MTSTAADAVLAARPNFRELVAEVVRRAASAPLSPADPVDSISALLALDPRNTSHFYANVVVIVCDALADPGRETHANRWRPVRPAWVRPATVGATVNRLTALGVLRPTGRYVRSTDKTGRNRNKLVPVHTLDVAALRKGQTRSRKPVPGPRCLSIGEGTKDDERFSAVSVGDAVRRDPSGR